ncbi:MAG: hypothetical protein WB999_12520, partial [Candidatus Binataceae bacterium]
MKRPRGWDSCGVREHCKEEFAKFTPEASARLWACDRLWQNHGTASLRRAGRSRCGRGASPTAIAE